MQGLGLVQDLGFGVRSRELRVFGFLGVQPLQYSTVQDMNTETGSGWSMINCKTWGPGGQDKEGQNGKPAEKYNLSGIS